MEPERKHSQPVLVYPFFIPKTKKVEFYKFIQTQDIGTRDNLQAATAARDELVVALERESNFHMINQTVDRYLPCIYGIACSIENNPNIRMVQPLGRLLFFSPQKSN